jgi:hypothetical protein
MDGTQRPGFPGPALKHKMYSYRERGLPADLKLSVDEFRTGIVSDLGGADALTTLQIAYVQRLCDVEVAVRLLTNDLAVRGVFTARGRVRSTFSRLLETIDRWDKLAQRVGVERRPKPVPSPLEYWAQRGSDTDNDHDDDDDRGRSRVPVNVDAEHDEEEVDAGGDYRDGSGAVGRDDAAGHSRTD